MTTTAWTIASRRAQGLARVADYVELARPKIAALVLITVAVAGFVARWGQPDLVDLLHALVGTALIAASASAMNQWWERRSDALMERTRGRPLPSGRLTATQVLAAGSVSLLSGLGYLTLTVGGLTGLLGALTWSIYVGLYTPLKYRTIHNTLVGAIAGAMPVAIGWSAVGGRLELRALALFWIVFLWQFPHFMAIAWIYRRQYGRAGLRMITVVDPSGRRAGVQAVLAALALLPVSFLPGLVTPAAAAYIAGAFLLGSVQLVCAMLFLFQQGESSARRLLNVSLIYLPALLTLLTLLPFL
jgi:protoheme IX farnesyltransferase